MKNASETLDMSAVTTLVAARALLDDGDHIALVVV
jgi:hypothetical protein